MDRITPEDAPLPDLTHVLRERDLYRRLLDLGAQDELEPFLHEALGLFVELAGARRGYLELQDDGGDHDAPRFWIARGCSDGDVADIRATLSQGVIAEAIATRTTIATASALEDPRFRNRASVRKNRIEAILCAPIGVDPPLGVLYLQERLQPGSFTDEDVQRAETFARHIAALADRLLIRRRRREESDPTLPFRSKLHVDGLIGRSAAMARLLQEVAVVAPRDVAVLLTGASGTGKTQLARVIHDNGPRSAGPFVELNCAALPEALLESELFGALPGAHSTAARKVEGKVAAAERGTLFLDEIGELPLAAQAKLLQLLQSKEYFPLGGSRVVKADVRVIAATNVDLKAAVTSRKFREDLRYRLQVIPIRVPSLAERREDVSALAAYFCACACKAYDLPQLRLSPGARRAAEAAEWPGNVRELEHAIQAAALRAAGDGLVQIERRHLFPEAAGEIQSPVVERLTFQQATRRYQKQLLLDTLEETGWNVTETANLLDIARAHVYNLIRAFGIERQK
ncbi:sigma 54-interacting transcriptional regulator [Sorangium sp. So ce131]|uniref:sigma 54-interacting transcriptional regulator n=1 Tax=Sorangium sp. So ce131 TaxID=3133282 RepID=UPI003F6034D2